MAAIQRTPGPALRPFVRNIWVSEGDRGSAIGSDQREHVLPTGCVHVVLRLAGPALRIFAGPEDLAGRTLGTAIVGGARSGYYVREVSEPVWSVGAELLPGAAPLVLGIPAHELAERHTPLDDLWGRGACEARERIASEGSAASRLALFEAILAERMPRIRGMHPAVAEALSGFGARAKVRALVARSGYSHRRAHAAGYSDQAHFTREFRDFAGVSPGRYRELAPRSPHHLPVRG